MKIVCSARHTQYMYFIRLIMWELILHFNILSDMLCNVFFRVIDGSPQKHLWYQVNAVVDRALPTHTYTLQAHTFSQNTLNITLKNPLPETVTLLQVSKHFIV